MLDNDNNLVLACFVVCSIMIGILFSVKVSMVHHEAVIDAIETAECSRECVYPQERQKK